MPFHIRNRAGQPAIHDSFVILLAALLDAWAGDPPNRFHPVAWLGSAIALAQRRAPGAGRAGPLLYGGALTATGVGATAGLGQLLTRLCRRGMGRRWPLIGALTEAWLLKMTFSASGLGRAAGDVLAALQADQLDEARRRLAWHLVSRDTGALDEAQVCSAVIESVAENLCDSVVAPLCYYACAGLSGAWAYRFANTADAMLGYRDAAREWLGKIPARLDDGLNVLPARLSALLLWLAGGLAGCDMRQGWQVWRRDARSTASPNAGHPMSMMAGLLGVRLEKIGHYQLGAALRPPGPADVARSIRVMQIAAGLAVMACAALAAVGQARASRH